MVFRRKVVLEEEHYFKPGDSDFLLEINKLKSLMNIKPGDKALDIGAGLGKSMIALEKVGFDAYGIEPSEPFHKRAIEKMGIKPDKIKLASVEDSDYPATIILISFTFSVVLEHLYDPFRLIEKAL